MLSGIGAWVVSVIPLYLSSPLTMAPLEIVSMVSTWIQQAVELHQTSSQQSPQPTTTQPASSQSPSTTSTQQQLLPPPPPQRPRPPPPSMTPTSSGQNIQQGARLFKAPPQGLPPRLSSVLQSR